MRMRLATAAVTVTVTAALMLVLAAPAAAESARLCSPDGDAKMCAQTWPRVPTTLANVDAQVDALLARMTLRDKVGQLIMAEIQSVTPAEVRRYRLGGILNGGGSYPGKKPRRHPRRMARPRRRLLRRLDEAAPW